MFPEEALFPVWLWETKKGQTKDSDVSVFWGVERAIKHIVLET